jgi:hypothetical protein
MFLRSGKNQLKMYEKSSNHFCRNCCSLLHHRKICPNKPKISHFFDRKMIRSTNQNSYCFDRKMIYCSYKHMFEKPKTSHFFLRTMTWSKDHKKLLCCKVCLRMTYVSSFFILLCLIKITDVDTTNNSWT